MKPLFSNLLYIKILRQQDFCVPHNYCDQICRPTFPKFDLDLAMPSEHAVRGSNFVFQRCYYESLHFTSHKLEFLVERRRTVRLKPSSNVFRNLLSFSHLKNLDRVVDLFFLLFHSKRRIFFFHQPFSEFCFIMLFAFVSNFLPVAEPYGCERFFLF